MRAVKSRDTAPEIAVRGILHRLGYRFRLGGAGLVGTAAAKDGAMGTEFLQFKMRHRPGAGRCAGGDGECRGCLDG